LLPDRPRGFGDIIQIQPIVIVGDPGLGYTDDPYQQFNPAAFTTLKSGSIGLESGTSYRREQRASGA